MNLLDLVSSSLGALLGDFLNPQKRIFIGYLLFSIFIALVVLWCRWKGAFSVVQMVQILFSRKVWFSQSTIADVKLIVFNKLLFGGMGTRLVSKTAVGFGVYFLLKENVRGSLGFLTMIPPYAVPVLFTVTLFLVDDYSRYWVHRLMHRVPYLWNFHRVHHSATVMTPLTVFRTHPVEALIFSMRGAVVQGCVVGVFFAFFESRLTLMTIFGANAASVIFHAVGSNLRHSHIPFRYPRFIERWLLSPAQHQIHHSISTKHYDKNYGVAFSVWDRIHGSFHYSETYRLKFGLVASDPEHSVRHTLRSLVLHPFLDPVRHLAASIKVKILNAIRLHLH